MTRIALLSIMVMFLMVACGQSPVIEVSEPIATEEIIAVEIATTEEIVVPTALTPESSAEIETPAGAVASGNTSADLPAWANIELVNVNTNETFTLADFPGKTVYVHMMATWCTNCRASQLRLNADVVPQVGDDVVFVSIDVQTQLGSNTLAEYTTTNGFEWAFAVASNDLMNALATDFGRTVSNPPSTPHFVIYPDGTVTNLQTGGSSAASVIALIRGEA